MENGVESGRLGDSIMTGRMEEAGVRPGPVNGAVTHWVRFGFMVQNVSISRLWRGGIALQVGGDEQQLMPRAGTAAELR